MSVSNGAGENNLSGGKGNRLDIVLPQYPLPEEIRSMKRDETVCKYCGVSYLIHAEIKALEEKLQLTEDQLQRCKDAEKREVVLKEELKNKQDEFNLKDAEIGRMAGIAGGRQTRIDEIEKVVYEKDEAILALSQRTSEQENELGRQLRIIELYRLKHAHLTSQFTLLSTNAKLNRRLVKSIKSEVLINKTTVSDYCQQISSQLVHVLRKNVEETEALLKKIRAVESERLTLVAERDSIQTKLSSIQELLDIEKKATVETKRNYEKLQLELKDVTEKLKLSIQNSESQSVEFRNKAEQAECTLRNLEQEQVQTMMTIARLKTDIDDRDVLLRTCRHEIELLNNMVTQSANEKEAMSQNAEQSVEIQRQLKVAKTDLKVLRSEREEMIRSHQQLIDQLRETFAQQLLDAESRLHKAEEAADQERKKLSSDMTRLEENFKRNFIMEMEIEREKCVELLNNNKLESAETIEKLTAELRLAESSTRSKSELLLARNELSRAKETESSLRAEVNGFNRLVSDLELKLSRVTITAVTAESQCTELRSKVSNSQAQLTRKDEELSKLATELTASKQEIVFLYETVRRECEERSELTEALSRTKEQLLQYRKPLNGYSTSQLSLTDRCDSTRASVTAPSSAHIQEMGVDLKHPSSASRLEGGSVTSNARILEPIPPAGGKYLGFSHSAAPKPCLDTSPSFQSHPPLSLASSYPLPSSSASLPQSSSSSLSGSVMISSRNRRGRKKLYSAKQ